MADHPDLGLAGDGGEGVGTFGGLAPLEPPPELSDAEFSGLYERHCAGVFEAVTAQQWGEVDGIWEQFWQSIPCRHIPLLQAAAGIEYCRAHDRRLYASIVDALIPDVFRCMSSTLTKQIRGFAKHLEDQMSRALRGLPDSFVRVKIQEVVAFSQRLRRHTSLNHLAQAARGTLTKQTHLQQMVQDYRRIDFATVTQQVAWVCEGCEPEAVSSLEASFSALNKGPNNNLEGWAQWLQSVRALPCPALPCPALRPSCRRLPRVSPPAWPSPCPSQSPAAARGPQVVRTCLGAYEGQASFSRRAGELLLRWSFVSSLVIRDLTLRSATSFGMFHLMRLLCDGVLRRPARVMPAPPASALLARSQARPRGAEYIFYLVEKAVAAGRCPSLEHVEEGGSPAMANTEVQAAADEKRTALSGEELELAAKRAKMEA